MKKLIVLASAIALATGTLAIGGVTIVPLDGGTCCKIR